MLVRESSTLIAAAISLVEDARAACGESKAKKPRTRPLCTFDTYSYLGAFTMTENREVMVCQLWTLRLRQTGVGIIELPAVYTTESDAVAGAYKFIEERHAKTENWFCQHPRP